MDMDESIRPVVIGTYTRKEGHVDGKATGIYLYKFDSKTGKLSYVSVAEGIVNPSYVAASGLEVVAASEVSPGEITHFFYNQDNMTLVKKSSVSSYGDYPCYISFSPHGNQVYVANYGSGSVAAYELRNTRLELLDTAKHEGNSVTNRQQSAHAHMFVENPTNPNEIIAADLGTDKIYVYQKQQGKLKLNHHVMMNPGSGPRQLAFHPHQSIIYVLNELSGSVATLIKDSVATYQLLGKELSLTDIINDMDVGAADIQITPDGKYLYASVRGGMNKIFVLQITDNGQLLLMGNVSSGGKTPRAIKIDGSGKFLFSLNQDSDNIVTYQIKKDGMLDSIANSKVLTPVSMDFLY